MHGAAESRCLHGELRVCQQKGNEAYDCQPGSIQGDRIPASKLGQCPQSCGLGATPRFWGGVGR